METTPKLTPQIAIVGTEGSGKTILASVLAKRMSSNTEGNIFLHPRGWETAEYVEKVWNVLNNGEWWKSTEAGYTFELQWTLHIGQLSVPMKLIDSAGQDLRELFSKNTYKQKNLSGIQRELLDYIQTASVVILVVNLLHFRGEPDGLKRKQNEFVLKEVIDMFAADSKHQDIAVVFTAWDLYYADITKNYGNFTNYLQKELPQLYNAMRLGFQSGDSIHWFPVAAVMDTELKNNIRVPKSNFRSGGLDTLSNWLINIVQREQNKEHVEKQANEYEIKMQQLNNWLIPIVSGTITGLCGLLGGGVGIAFACFVVGLILGRAGMLVFIEKVSIFDLPARFFGKARSLFSAPKNANEKNKTETADEKIQQKQSKTEKSRKPSESSGKAKPPEQTNAPYNIDSADDDLTLYDDEIVSNTTVQPSERKSKSMKF
ncbi:MAG: hypothetical protein LBC02_12545 [Planctomycetaceae bacterium]|jgi:GTPase SAR1 family protein|nr:hypothetical protein [Planctomycetaceae bacterium]